MNYDEIKAMLHAKEAAADKKRNEEAARWKTTHRQEEHNLQARCVKWFRNEWPELSGVFFAVPNGGVIGQSKSKAEHAKAGAKRRDEGVLAGVSDLLLLVARNGYHGLCIEMKTEDKKSRQIETQKEFERNVVKQGYEYVVVRSYEDFKEKITWYLASHDRII